MQNSTFFDDLNDEAQSYWLGFFCADGGFHPNLKQFGFQLARKDRQHLEKLAALFSLHVKDGSTFDKRTQKRYFWSKLTIHSKAMIRTMFAYGIPTNKTNDLDGEVFDHIPQKTLHHFVRGYFDGDGCISYVGKAEYRVAIVGTLAFLERMRTLVNASVQIEFPSAHRRGRNLHGIGLCGTERINLFKGWLYSGASVSLERKKKIFDLMPIHRGSSKYKGVHRSAKRNAWIARVYENKKMRTLGQFKKEADAAARLIAYFSLASRTD